MYIIAFSSMSNFFILYELIKSCTPNFSRNTNVYNLSLPTNTVLFFLSELLAISVASNQHMEYVNVNGQITIFICSLPIACQDKDLSVDMKCMWRCCGLMRQRKEG